MCLWSFTFYTFDSQGKLLERIFERSLYFNLFLQLMLVLPAQDVLSQLMLGLFVFFVLFSPIGVNLQPKHYGAAGYEQIQNKIQKYKCCPQSSGEMQWWWLASADDGSTADIGIFSLGLPCQVQFSCLTTWCPPTPASGGTWRWSDLGFLLAAAMSCNLQTPGGTLQLRRLNRITADQGGRTGIRSEKQP